MDKITISHVYSITVDETRNDLIVCMKTDGGVYYTIVVDSDVPIRITHGAGPGLIVELQG